MVSALMQPYKGVGRISPTGGAGSQFPDCSPQRSSPDLTRVGLYHGKAIMSVPCGILYPNQQESNVVVGLLSLPPDLKAIQGGQFHLRVAGELEPV